MGNYKVGNKEYSIAYEKKRHLLNPDRRRATVLKSRYGVSLEEYNTMFESQGGECKICKRHQTEFSKRLRVDHCHKTGRVRGLLCSRCNLHLGQYEQYKNSFEEYLNGI